MLTWFQWIKHLKCQDIINQRNIIKAVINCSEITFDIQFVFLLRNNKHLLGHATTFTQMTEMPIMLKGIMTFVNFI